MNSIKIKEIRIREGVDRFHWEIKGKILRTEGNITTIDS